MFRSLDADTNGVLSTGEWPVDSVLNRVHVGVDVGGWGVTASLRGLVGPTSRVVMALTLVPCAADEFSQLAMLLDGHRTADDCAAVLRRADPHDCNAVTFSTAVSCLTSDIARLTSVTAASRA
jgi:hypothetical protein